MKSCRTCHFLAKTHVARTGQEFRLTWDQGERQTGEVAEYYAAECAQGIWSMRIDPGLQLKDVLATNRKRGCFYLEMKRGMSFPAARTLLEEQERNRRSRRERLTLWIAVASVLVAVIATSVAVLSFLRNDLPWSRPATGVEAGQDENSKRGSVGNG